MKITGIRTFRLEEFANLLWVHVETDAGITGLGETFYGAASVEAHIHDTLASRLVGKNPLHIEALHREMLNLPHGPGFDRRGTSRLFGSGYRALGYFRQDMQTAGASDAGRALR